MMNFFKNNRGLERSVLLNLSDSTCLVKYVTHHKLKKLSCDIYRDRVNSLIAN